MNERTTRRGFLGRMAGGVALPLIIACDSKPAPSAAKPVTGASGTPIARPGLPTSTQTSKATTLIDGRAPEHFTQHSQNPLTLEARPEHFGTSGVTPNRQFFVRNNLPMPDPAIVERPDEWAVELGGIARPVRLTLGELKRLPAQSVTAVIQCSGNGRAFFEHGPSGSQWATGAAGCATWTGVRVRDLLDTLSAPEVTARFMTSTGGDPLPAGIERDLAVVERSIPISKALDDCLLAWEMNGVPIPLSNGGPLRLIVPGYFGVNHIKYVKHIRFTAEQTTAKIQKSGYRFRPIGQTGDAIHPSMWRMPVKSWLVGPGSAGEPILPGQRQLTGVALSGERGIKTVEYSLNGGKSWRPARLLGVDLGPSAWRVFQVPVDLGVVSTPGATQVMTRATDTAGDVQPRTRTENERGYANNSWLDHAVTLDVVATLPEVQAAVVGSTPVPRKKGPVKLSEAGRRGRDLAQTTAQPACGVCHTVQDLGSLGKVGPDLDALRPTEAQVLAAVTQGVGAMPSYRGALSEAQVRDIARYIVEATR